MAQKLIDFRALLEAAETCDNLAADMVETASGRRGNRAAILQSATDRVSLWAASKILRQAASNLGLTKPNKVLL